MQLSNSTFILINACITSFDGYLCMCIINMLFDIKQEKFKKFALYFASFLLSGMVIFIGDIANLTPTLIIFMFVIIKCTKGSLWKKITLSLILCCGPFSINALCDSFLRFDIHLLRPIYWILLYLFVKKIMPEKSFDLSSAYWKILILLTLTPLGILLSMVLLHNKNTLDYAYESITTVVLLSLSALSFVGLLYTVALLAKQQKLENDNMLYEMNQTYYKNME